VSGIGTTIACTIVKVFDEFQKFESVVIVWLVLSVLTDTVITLTMVLYLESEDIHRTLRALADLLRIAETPNGICGDGSPGDQVGETYVLFWHTM